MPPKSSSSNKEKEDNFIERIMKRLEEKYKMEQSLKQMNDQLFGNVEAVIPSEVKRFGSSGYIPFSKKYIGKKVKIIVLKDEGKQPKS